jgi:hypothetical protein
MTPPVEIAPHPLLDTPTRGGPAFDWGPRKWVGHKKERLREGYGVTRDGKPPPCSLAITTRHCRPIAARSRSPREAPRCVFGRVPLPSPPR